MTIHPWPSPRTDRTPLDFTWAMRLLWGTGMPPLAANMGHVSARKIAGSLIGIVVGSKKIVEGEVYKRFIAFGELEKMKLLSWTISLMLMCCCFMLDSLHAATMSKVILHELKKMKFFWCITILGLMLLSVAVDSSMRPGFKHRTSIIGMPMRCPKGYKWAGNRCRKPIL
ncbi:hypothetical protein KM043_015324 [Ampulex compressa]|nr:hypothetical protein KM043_015324 [Ampulex compressa]